jgi:hypothetical protein
MSKPDPDTVRSAIAGDLACAEFGVPSDIAEYVTAARRMASEIGRHGGGGAGVTTEGLRRIADLALDEMIADREAIAQPCPLLFLVADAFGHASLEAAWAGLASAPLCGALTDPGRFCFGLPSWHVAFPSGSASTWVAMSPLGGPISQILLTRPEPGVLVGPIDPDEPPAGFIVRRSTGLPGLPQARMIEIRTAVQADARLPVITDLVFGRYRALTAALLGGLIDGATRRLVDEAYAHARTRQSAGRILIQHQAVALRLADLAINHQALHHYLQAGLGRSSNAAHVGHLAFTIARDAVQIAGAHGYVEGLPFKRLFEQMRSLISAFALAAGTAGTL